MEPTQSSHTKGQLREPQHLPSPPLLSPPAAQSKQTQQQGQRMGLVKINHPCRGEQQGMKNSTARVTPNLFKWFKLSHPKVASPL